MDPGGLVPDVVVQHADQEPDDQVGGQSQAGEVLRKRFELWVRVRGFTRGSSTYAI